MHNKLAVSKQYFFGIIFIIIGIYLAYLLLILSIGLITIMSILFGIKYLYYRCKKSSPSNQSIVIEHQQD